MKIAQITPGFIRIDKNLKWGAIERIILNYQKSFIKLGHQCDIKYLNEVSNDKYDIIHIHVADLAIQAKKRGIKHIFTLHDHHVEIFKGTKLLNEKAIEGAEMAFVPSEHLLKFFNNPPNLYYVPHGVDIDLYTTNNEINNTEFKLLCVGNNGMDGNYTIDRKGFLYAIDIANKFNLELTIAGPSNSNKDFFEHYKDRLTPNITLIFDPTEKELVKIYQEHDIFLHPSNLEAGHPNLTLLEATACGLPIVGTFKGGEDNIPSMLISDLNNKSLEYNLRILLSNYSYYKELTKKINKYSWDNIVKILEEYYVNVTTDKSVNNNIHTHKEMKDTLTSMYNNLKYNNHIYKNRFIISYLDGVKLTVKGFDKKTYNVKFIDKDVNEVVYETNIKNGSWSQPNKKYYVNWKIVINDEIEYDLNLQDKKVLITFESSALGDNIAWIPYIEEFRKQHNCLTTVSTFHNNLYEKNYPNIEFVEPGVNLDEYHAWYRIGVFDNEGKDNYDKNKNSWREIPLQQTITDILGLEYKEIKPDIYSNDEERIIKEKYVVISPHSTLKAKLWNYVNGWENITKRLKALGYKVICLTKNPENIKGTKNYNNLPLNEVVNIVNNAEFLIGLGSGLSWLSWGLNTPVIMISGFSRKYAEFDCYRITTPNGFCTGCYNDKLSAFDRGDWNWCPRKKDFECTKTITPIMMNKVINELIEKEKLK